MLLDVIVKEVTGMFDKLLWEGTDIGYGMWFGFLQDGGTVAASFLDRQLYDSCSGKDKTMCFLFLNLEKTLDSGPGEVV